MGIERERFVDQNIDDYICSICLKVFDLDFKQDKDGHTFCKSCIETWLSKKLECPISRCFLVANMLQEMPYIAKNLLKRLEVHCRFKKLGCDKIIKYEDLKSHEEACSHRACDVENGCQLAFKVEHCGVSGCINNLKLYLKEKDDKIDRLQRLVFKQNKEIMELKEQMRKVTVQTKPKVTVTTSAKTQEEHLDTSRLSHSQQHEILTSNKLKEMLSKYADLKATESTNRNIIESQLTDSLNFKKFNIATNVSIDSRTKP